MCNNEEGGFGERLLYNMAALHLIRAPALASVLLLSLLLLRCILPNTTPLGLHACFARILTPALAACLSRSGLLIALQRLLGRAGCRGVVLEAGHGQIMLGRRQQRPLLHPAQPLQARPWRRDRRSRRCLCCQAPLPAGA